MWSPCALDELFAAWAAPAGAAALRALQRGLLRNGFQQLAPGGSLVYSTCSFARAQNEDVVRWLLAHEPAASLLPARVAGPVRRSVDLGGAVYMDPSTSGTSGLFVAVLTKQRSAPSSLGL